ncbi:MAG: hypothetical protein M3285_03115 [Actinomycetota bacterium]|nr:hypothetical protein [Actinomycetota bacterium]
MQRPELRPLGVGETVDVSLKLYLRHAATLLGIAAVMIIPVYIIFNLILISMAPDDAIVRDGLILMPLQSDADAFNRVLLGFVVISVLAAMLATGAAFKAVADAYLGDKPSIGDSLRFAGSRLHSLIWLSILYALLVIVGLVALIIPGIYLAVAFCVAVPALILEGHKGSKALGRSRDLVKDRWWPTLGAFILGLVLIPIVVGVILGFVFEAAIPETESVTSFLALQATQEAIIDVFSAPLQAAVLTVIYFDLRVRKEGFDLQLLAERMGSTGPGSAGEPGPGQPPPPTA